MKNRLFILVSILFLCTPAIIIADSLQVGDSVIVTATMKARSRCDSNVAQLLLGVVKDTGGTDHYLHIYEVVCRGSENCGYFSQDQMWISERNIIAVSSDEMQRVASELGKKGLSPEDYYACQLKCILSNFK